MATRRINGKDARFTIKDADGNVIQSGRVTGWDVLEELNQKDEKLESWPYGPAEFHEECCLLHETQGVGFCDCKASDSSDGEWGLGAWPSNPPPVQDPTD